ncbi:MAG: tetratricopeptide repeat protein [Methanothrix sp.]|nr:MAG: tetratricopeptide repeat protein [Methanothrix sp.]
MEEKRMKMSRSCLMVFLLLAMVNMSLPAASQEQVAETIYVQEVDMNGTLLSGVQVIGQDAAGYSFEGVTDSNGTAIVSGLPGAWQFLFVKDGYEPLKFSSNVTETGEGVVYLQKSSQSSDNTTLAEQNSQENQTSAKSMSMQEWYNLGISMQKEGKYAEAAEAFDEVVRIDPKFAMAWYNKYVALRELGRNSEADAALSEAKNLSYDASL